MGNGGLGTFCDFSLFGRGIECQDLAWLGSLWAVLIPPLSPSLARQRTLEDEEEQERERRRRHRNLSTTTEEESPRLAQNGDQQATERCWGRVGSVHVCAQVLDPSNEVEGNVNELQVWPFLAHTAYGGGPVVCWCFAGCLMGITHFILTCASERGSYRLVLWVENGTKCPGPWDQAYAAARRWDVM